MISLLGSQAKKLIKAVNDCFFKREGLCAILKMWADSHPVFCSYSCRSEFSVLHLSITVLSFYTNCIKKIILIIQSKVNMDLSQRGLTFGLETRLASGRLFRPALNVRAVTHSHLLPHISHTWGGGENLILLPNCDLRCSVPASNISRQRAALRG